MIRDKNYETASSFVKVIQRKLLASFFPDKLYIFVCLEKFVVVRCIPGSALPGCVDDDSLIVVVADVVEDVGTVMVSASAAYKRPNIY